MEGVAVPGARVAPIARQVASSAKIAAALSAVCFIVLACLVAAGTLSGARSDVAAWLTMIAFEALLAVVAVTGWRTGSRADRVAALADAADSGHVFMLENNTIGVIDPSGRDLRDLAFTIRNHQRRELLELPHATAQPR